MFLSIYLYPIKSIQKHMTTTNSYTQKNGKICYLEIPANDIAISASFYRSVFDWKTRQRGDGALAFDDSLGEVSGTWVTGREVNDKVGILTYIMVDDIHDTVNKISANGGKIVQPVGVDAPELTARFTDPAGNIFGVYQEPVK
jgi:uncharacterized protein